MIYMIFIIASRLINLLCTYASYRKSESIESYKYALKSMHIYYSTFVQASVHAKTFYPNHIIYSLHPIHNFYSFSLSVCQKNTLCYGLAKHVFLFLRCLLCMLSGRILFQKRSGCIVHIFMFIFHGGTVFAHYIANALWLHLSSVHL